MSMTRARTLALAAACTIVGATGALGVDAITSWAHFGHHHRSFAAFHPGAGGFVGRAVHADAVLVTRDGFKNLTYDRGVVKDISGQSLTITEGRDAVTKDVTLTIPGDAKIRVPGKTDATLADVQNGWKVVVAQLAGKTVVFAHPPFEGMHP